MAAGAVLLVVVTTGGIWMAVAGRRVAIVRTVVATSRPASAVAASVLNASGYVSARRRATVSSTVTATVKGVLVEEGWRVRAGDILAELDDSQARGAVALAEAQLASSQQRVAEERILLRDADLRFRRHVRLAEEGLLPRADLETSEAQLDALAARVARAELEAAAMRQQVAVRRIDLSDTIIRAPFDGIVISKDAQPGETISPTSGGGSLTRTGIGTIVDMSSLEVEVEVNETFINRVKPRQPVIATLDAYPEWQIPAYVITTIPAADRQKATVLVRIAFEALDQRILPDMGVKVTFLDDAAPEAAERVSTRVMIPRRAVRREGAADVVYVMRDTRADRRLVRLGRTDGENVEVLAEVLSGERVVVEGPPHLTDGVRIREDHRP